MVNRRTDEPISFAEAVMVRPGMYTFGGTFDEAVSFLEGYFSGVAKGAPYAAPAVEWGAFREWVADKLEARPDEGLKRFRERYGSGPASLSKLADWFLEFQGRRVTRETAEAEKVPA